MKQIIAHVLVLSCLAVGLAVSQNTCTPTQIREGVTAIDAVAKQVCGQGDPLLTCLDKIEGHPDVIAARRMRYLAPVDGGARE